MLKKSTAYVAALMMGLILLAFLPNKALAADDVEILMPPSLEYRIVQPFCEGLAAVLYNSGWGVIDLTGKVVVPCDYAFIFDFTDGLARVIKMVDGDEKYGYIDKTGAVVVPIVYDEAYAFSEGLAVIKKDGKWGLVDEKGQIAVPLEYDYVQNIREGLIAAQKNGRAGYIDKTNNLVVPFEYDFGEDFCEGLAKVGKDGKYGFIDKSGKLVIPCVYDIADSFHEGFAPVRKNPEGSLPYYLYFDEQKCGYINRTGKLIVPYIYDFVWPYCDGLAKVVLDEKYGFIDKTGAVVVPIEYDNTDKLIEVDSFLNAFARPYYFIEGLSMVDKDGKCGYIDNTGAIVVPLEYDDARNFNEGLAAVKKDEKWGYIDKTGAIVVPLKYYEAYDFSEGMAAVKEKYSFGFIDKTGEMIVPMKYYSVTSFNSDLALTQNDYGKYGVLTSSADIFEKVVFSRIVTPTAAKVMFNGEAVSFDAYNIGGNNYVKLRDIAYVLNGSKKQFEIGWNRENNTVLLTGGKPYTPVGGEMATQGSSPITPLPANLSIMLNGSEITLGAYNINGNNYFKLRDIGYVIDFGVDWDEKSGMIIIDTESGYTWE